MNEPVDVESLIAEGTPVVSSQGEVLGTIGETGAARFKVRAPLAPDYWLDTADILGAGEGGDIVMRFDIGELDAYMRPGPEESVETPSAPIL